MTKVEFMEWRDHPVTKELIRMFTEVRDAYAERLVGGFTIDEPTKTSKDVGVIKGLDFFLKAQFEEEDKEDED